MSELQRSFVEPEGVAPPAGKYSHAIRVRGGEMLFIAGPDAPDIRQYRQGLEGGWG